MREDWDLRATQDAERFIYTRDSPTELEDFAQSGEVSYNQQIQPFLPILLEGRPAKSCSVVEIGCGIGRMTEWFARDFGSVDALDVSPVMIEGARQRLGHLTNVCFSASSGSDLAPVADCSADLVFSFIVFQHIPSRQAIRDYVLEAARVLKEGGIFKFQVNGDQSPGYLAHERDTWLGETYSKEEILTLLAETGFSPISLEGAGTQYFVVTARKGNHPIRGSYILPCVYSGGSLLEGFGEAVDDSWRPMASRTRVRLNGSGSRLYLGVYFWPGVQPSHVVINGHSLEVQIGGYRYFECPGAAGDVEIAFDPAPSREPAFRVIGLY